MGEEHDHGQRDRLGVFVHPRCGADRGYRPEGGGGRQSAHLGAFVHDDAGAEEADAGGDGAQAGTWIGSSVCDGDLGENAGRGGDQGGGSKASGMAAPFSLRTDGPAEQGGDQDGRDGVEGGWKVHWVRVGRGWLRRREGRQVRTWPAVMMRAVIPPWPRTAL